MFWFRTLQLVPAHEGGGAITGEVSHFQDAVRSSPRLAKLSGLPIPKPAEVVSLCGQSFDQHDIVSLEEDPGERCAECTRVRDEREKQAEKTREAVGVEDQPGVKVE